MNSSTHHEQSFNTLEAFYSSELYQRPTVLIFVTFIFLLLWSRNISGNALVAAPILGPKYTLFARYQFFVNARVYVETGYKKFKSSIFKLSGQDILVISNKYVDELRNIPESKLSSIQANIDNFEGLYSTTSILLEGHLHTETIQRRLTPKLGVLVPLTANELTFALKQELPAGTEAFTDFKGFNLVLRLVSHIAARHFVGHPLCESEDWISTALQYTENAFRTIIFLRIFPNWLKPIVGFFLPYSWKVSSALKHAQELVVPIVLQRRKAESSGDPTYEKPEDFLQWMMDGANEHDGEPHRLAHRLLILTLAAVHTTSMAATQTLFDLCTRPEYILPLQGEVVQAVTEDNGFQKPTLTKLRKLDSFMRESQRINPPSLLGFKRSVRSSITLSDGLVLPKDVHLMMPVSPIVMDPAIVPNPTDFLGFRHYELRQRPGESMRHQFATTSSDNLHFGHGKYSCPGRFFAANSIKMIMSRLLLEFDFKFPDNVTARPPNVELHEYCFPNPEAVVMFREKTSKLWTSKAEL